MFRRRHDRRHQFDLLGGSTCLLQDYPIASLMSTIFALQANLKEMAQRRSGDCGDLPAGQITMAEFKQVIGWQKLEALQARLEASAGH